jgi:hypothetical protein
VSLVGGGEREAGANSGLLASVNIFLLSGGDNYVVLDRKLVQVHHRILFYLHRSMSSKYMLQRRYHQFGKSGPGN